MTTISRNTLINPMARTKGGCASNNTHQTHDRDREEVPDGYNGMMPILGIQEDEDIASIEAEGTGDTDNDGGAAKSQSRDVESKILTAALVTSMEDASRGGDKPKSQDNQAVDSNSMYQHVTPITSESSSVETTDSGDSHNASSIPHLNPTGARTTRKTPNPLSSNGNAMRTIYPRASKSAACTKVASALHCNGSPRSKRKMVADKLESTKPTGKLMYPIPPVPHGFHPGSASVPNPLAGMDASKMHPPQVTFQYMQYPQAKSSVATAPSSNKKSRTNSFSQVATSMSTQQYQTDNLMSSSTSELMSSQSNQPEQDSRGRIFSIDLDPSVLDFVDNVDNPLGESVSQGRKRGYSVTFDDDVNSNSGKTSNRRDRGFSFELFSLGIDGDVPLPLIEDSNSSVTTDERGNRARGDSIIFDPISFHDGGIHETSALIHVTHEGDQDTQGQACSNAAVIAPPVRNAKVPPSIIHNPPMRPSVPNQHLTKRQQRGVVTSHKPLKGSARHSKPTKLRAKAKSSHAHVNHQPKSNYRQVTVNTSTRNFPQSFDDDTIHMPHGSHAATAAAAGMAPPSSTPSDGISSISHTSCPLELLNKDGRVGIYLPEERKARITKFHDKRKQRMWRKKIKYDCRKKLADSRPRIKGRFVKRSDVN